MFPFIYKGNVYTNCTFDGRHDRLWCATTSSYDVGKTWGNCVFNETGCPGNMSKNKGRVAHSNFEVAAAD